MRAAHVDPFAGVSGDMLLGAVIDSGVPAEEIVATLDGLGLDGWDLETSTVSRAGLGATQAVLSVRDDGVIRTWAHVREMISGAKVPEPVRFRALATFRRLAEAESAIHRRTIERVHFHEVGALAALLEIVGVCAGLHLLELATIVCGPVAQGVGMRRTEHGLLPIPAPIVLELLRGAPTYSSGVTHELCSPTGAALLAEWADRWGPMPPMAIDRVGYGAGPRGDIDRPHLLRMVIGEAIDTPPAAWERQERQMAEGDQPLDSA
ncbi:MAG TPA: LarC family nickel insertion protein [Egibacteraceae bacterium]|nr:LarC family nickel insertion protein [Egibacteraceae bacterium]